LYTLPTRETDIKEGFNDSIRKDKIIKFLEFHQGCNKEDLVRGVANIMSKKTTYKILNELIQDNIVKQEKEKPNSKNYRLFLNSNNYLLIVSDELDKFEKSFFNLLNKFEKNGKSEKFEKLKDLRSEYYEFITRIIYAHSVITLPLQIIDFVLHTYMIKCFFIWPYIISDKKLLKKINQMIFSKISDIFIHSLNILPLQRYTNNLELSTKIIEKEMVFDKHTLGSMSEMIENIEYYKLFNFEKEYEHLLDILWEINREILKVVFNNQPIVIFNPLLEGRIYEQQSQIDINKDNWRKIISEKMLDPRKNVHSEIKLQYTGIKMDNGLRLNEAVELAEEMIQELEKISS
jgi:hypothetical protein